MVPTLGPDYILAGALVIAGDDLRLLNPGYVHVRDGLVVDVGEGSPPSSTEASHP